MPDPVVVPREHHRISRRDIDPDALRVLSRLQQHKHVAYLVGGSVRDLLLGRRPKDFDIGTDAHPNQIKRIFRNSWIIGRRFRLAHIKFGLKTIEVATFRKHVPDDSADSAPAASEEAVVVASAAPPASPPLPPPNPVFVPADHHISGGDESPRPERHAPVHHRDNTFGTPEEDAFRRDFTVNALLYDSSTKSVIDYVGGLEDLERRVIRSIGDPGVRFVEDPVRMFRAAVLGARLGFELDSLVYEAIQDLGHTIVKASAARMLEEYFKVLRSGYAEVSFRALWRTRLLQAITPELQAPPEGLWDSLRALDKYRQQHVSAPAELTNAILIGSLLSPLGALKHPGPDRGIRGTDDTERIKFGILPVARKDLDRLRQMMQILPRLSDPVLPPRVARSLPHRPSFADALTWFEVFGGDPAIVHRWKSSKEDGPRAPADRPPGQRRRRRRRGRRGPRPPQA